MDLRDDLVRHYRWLRQYGINDSHSGNMSVRDGEQIWITPTGACADTLESRDLVQCSTDGTRDERASLDAPLHIEVYRHNPQARAVVHSQRGERNEFDRRGRELAHRAPRREQARERLPGVYRR